MRSPSASLARALPLVLTLGALLAFGGAARRFADATRPSRAEGFTQLQAPGSTCTAESGWERRAARSVVPEPFVASQERPDTCSVWRAFLAAPRPMRLSLELEAEDDALVLVDGERFVATPGAHDRATHAETRELPRGVHPFEVRASNRAGESYLRLRMRDLRDTAPPFALPLARGSFFVSRFDAERAVASVPDAAAAPAPTDAPATGPPGRPDAPPEGRARSAALLAALGALLAWLALRSWRLRFASLLHRLAGLDLLGAGALSALALGLRMAFLRETDPSPAEMSLWAEGANDVRNAMLGDWSPAAFGTHASALPVPRWLAGLGAAMAGLQGARAVSHVLGALSVGFVYGAARALFGRVAGLGAALVFASMPPLVALGRLATPDGALVLWGGATLLSLALLLRSHGLGARAEARGEHGDPWAALALGASAALGLFSSASFASMAVPAALALGWARRRTLARGTLPVPMPALASLVGTTLLVLAFAPHLSESPLSALLASLGAPDGRVPATLFLGERVTVLPASYAALRWLVTTPLPVLIAAAAGGLVGLARRRTRGAAVCVLGALLAPAGWAQLLSRPGMADAIVLAWVPATLLAGLAADGLGAFLRARFRLARSPVPGRLGGASLRLGPLVERMPALLLGALALGSLRAVEPFPSGYFSTWVGGPARVEDAQLFDVSHPLDGIGHATEWLNAHARPHASVRFDGIPAGGHPRLRDDLAELPPASRADTDYVVLRNRVAGVPSGPGCARVHSIEVRGALLASVAECGGAAR